MLDGHTDVPARLFEKPADLARSLPDRQVDLPRLRAGGVKGVVFALYIPSWMGVEEGWRHVLALHDLTRARLIPGELEPAVAAEEVRRTVERGAVAVILGLENGRPLLHPGALERCLDLGLRYVTLTHIGNNEWCDAAGDAPWHRGLSPEGMDLVRRLNRMGILVDVSHASDEAVEQAVEVSRVPVVASHSSARALCDHPRNLPDPLLREMARRGGLVMVNSYPAFLDPEACQANNRRLAALGTTLAALEEGYARDPGAFAEARRKLFAAHPLPPVPLAAYVDHIVHLVEVAGEEHVGIGTDFDGIPETLEGFEDPSRFPDLTAALLERGLDPAGTRLILGENFLRLLREAERRAA